jgi:ATP-dependent exoDNAse (exonuclease V) beta subunit
METGEAALNRVLCDSWARWMLDAQRSERAAELPLTLACSTGTKSLVLDYVFVDEQKNERWVVDYKTAAPGAGETEAAFIAKQLEQYDEQLTSYVDALRLQFPEPVRCALYFTALGCHAELPDA